VPQAYALEQVVRRHARDAQWRRPAAGSYRIAVAPALLEELRTQIAYECIDVAPLPVATTAPAAPGASHHAKGIASREHHHGVTPLAPARTSMCVVSQILGEIAASSGDDEWMYMVGDGASQQSTNPSVARTSVQRRLGSTDAAAISAARTLLSGGGAAGYRPAITVEEISKFDTSASSHVRDSMDTGKTPADGTEDDGSRVPLPESNRVYLLLGDIARLRERGAVPTATVLAVVGSSPSPDFGTCAICNHGGASLQAAAVAAPAGPGHSPCATPRSIDSHAARLQAQQAHALEAKVLEVDAAVRKWESANPPGDGLCFHVSTAVATVRSVLAVLLSQAHK
jgi:hypothetical protein